MDKRVIVGVATVLFGVGGTMVAVVNHSGAKRGPEATSTGSSAPVGAPAQIDAGNSSAQAQAASAEEAAQAAAEAAQAAADGVPAATARRLADGPFPLSPGYGHSAYYEDSPGHCTLAMGHSAAELATDVEGSTGARITGYEGFKDGILVNFKDGARIAVWEKLIDCKDPPYDPQA
jgi:hypothetical protein